MSVQEARKNRTLLRQLDGIAVNQTDPVARIDNGETALKFLLVKLLLEMFWINALDFSTVQNPVT